MNGWRIVPARQYFLVVFDGRAICICDDPAEAHHLLYEVFKK